MPIYAYRCEHCGHAQDVLQKVSDPVLTVCPACGQATYRKQVTAAGFQLKGSGWYVTDFRDGSKKAAAKPEGEKAGAAESNGTNGHADAGASNGSSGASSTSAEAGAGSPKTTDGDGAKASPATPPPASAPGA